MGLQDKTWERKYRSDGGRPLSDSFFKPALSFSEEYCRGTGFFSSSLFEVLGSELAGFLRDRSGSMKIVTNVQLSKKDADALESTPSVQDLAEQKIQQIIETEFTLPLTDGVRAMISLLEIGRLEIKIAVTQGGGIYHEKMGYFRDASGDCLAWEGSPNDGLMAYDINFESVKVFPSWEPVKSDYCSDIMSDFDRLWNSETANLQVYSFSEASKKQLLRIKKQDEASPSRGSEGRIEPPAAPVPSLKWAHQDEAVRLFLKPRSADEIEPPRGAGGNGILCMATGTGKTRTACKIVTKMIKEGLIDHVIITTHYTDILDQWSIELDQRLSFIMQYAHFRNSRQSNEFEVSEFSNAALLCSREVFSRFIAETQIDLSRTLLIVDECHNFRGGGHVKSAGRHYKKFRYTLGLSATPHSPYSDEANLAMEEHLGEVFFEFGLEPAIRKSILTPFEYQWHGFSLMDEEQEKLVSTRRYFEGMIKGGKASQEQMMIALSRIYKLSEAKIPILRHLLTTNPDLLRRCIIFVETMEYGTDHVMPLLMELGGDYRTQWHHYFADADANQLDAFRKGELECLITCKKLNEGVDVPSITTIIMMSAEQGRDGLTTTQRIGRALRYMESDPQKISTVIDFIRTNATPGSNDTERRQWLQDLSAIRPDSWGDVE